MAVKNSLTKTQEAKPSGTTFTAGGNQITLNKGIVKQFLVNGDAVRQPAGNYRHR